MAAMFHVATESVLLEARDSIGSFSPRYLSAPPVSYTNEEATVS